MHFESVHHGFIERLPKRHPELSRTEVKVCAPLKIQMSTKEIAAIMSSSGKTIESHRHHIRKKLGLGADRTLTGYFAEI